MPPKGYKKNVAKVSKTSTKVSIPEKPTSDLETDRDAKNGNTIHSSAPKIVVKEQENQLMKWFFTWNNYPENGAEILETCFRQICKKYVFQEETGEKTGTPHLQGNILLKKRMRWSEFNLPIQMRWEKTRNEKAAFTYCAKPETRTGRTYTFGLPKPVKIITELRPFQQSIVDIIEAPVCEGKIHWIYDEIGQLGKTEMVRYLNQTKQIPFSYGGKCADIINLVYNVKDYLLENDNCCLLYNFGRETKPECISYKSMEQVSDGCIANTKFECGCFTCNKPHVIVFANCEPNRAALTDSRWIIYTINPESLELIRR